MPAVLLRSETIEKGSFSKYDELRITVSWYSDRREKDEDHQ